LANLVLEVGLRVEDNSCLVVPLVLYHNLSFLIITSKVGEVIVSKCLDPFKGSAPYKGRCPQHLLGFDCEHVLIKSDVEFCLHKECLKLLLTAVICVR
jgi:hypothetical protein